MVKNEAGSVNRAIDKRSKMKGLQKLRFYCQVCEKQCRDENGFKCHTQSESHLRQMLVVGESAGKHISDYTGRFQSEFVSLLSRRWGTKRVRINQVYQEYIADKNHLHMNATKFTSLTEFAKHLGREGIAHVDENEKGWWVSWIDNSPRALARQEASLKKDRGEMDDEMRMRKLIQQQIERARDEGEKRKKELAARIANGEIVDEPSGLATEENVDRELKRDEGEKVQLKMEFKMPNAAASTTTKAEGSVSPPTDSTALSTAAVEADSKPAPIKAFIPPPPKPTIGFTPKPNAFKMGGANPLKPNPLKSNPLKSSNPLKNGSSASSGTSGTSNGKRAAPMSAVEQIIADEMARKQRKLG